MGMHKFLAFLTLAICAIFSEVGPEDSVSILVKRVGSELPYQPHWYQAAYEQTG